MRLSIHRRWLAVLLAILLGFLCGRAFAQEVTIDAQVDRNQIQAGETVRFTLSLTVPMGSHGGQVMSPPQVDSIPGFDIVSRSTAQNMTWVNQQGMAQIQTRYELMPQQPGKAVIPGFSLKTPSGKTVTTKPIEITVLEPSAKADEEPDSETATTEAEGQGGMGFFKGFLLFIGVIALVISIPIGLSLYLNRGTKPAVDRFNKGTPGTPGAAARAGQPGSRPPSGETIAEEARARGPEKKPSSKPSREGRSDEPETVEPIPVSTDFDAELASLKRQFPEADQEFFRHLFDLFRRTVLFRVRRFGTALTPDELLRAIGRSLPSADEPRIKRLSEDWELVAFAGMAPTRGTSAILEDIRALLQSLRRLENETCHR